MNKLFFDLQRFAGDEEVDSEEVDEFEQLPLFAETEEEEISEEEEKPEEGKSEEETSAEEEKHEEEKKPEHKEKYFTQEDVNRIVQERLARDRKSKFVKELEEITGMPIENIVNFAKENKIRAKAEEMGVSEEEARRIVENEEKLRNMESQIQAFNEQQQAIKRVFEYSQQKAQYINNPLVRKYEKEIDDFAQGGLVLGFVPAMNYVLGQKVLDGELLENIQEGAEKRTLANLTKKGKVAVEDVRQKSDSVYLTPEEKFIAKMLGVSYKDYYKYKEKGE